jgi:ornithine carbamoyltransferase
MKRDFLSLADLTRAELEEILHLAATLKRDLKAGKRPPLLAGKSLAVTFEVGIAQLGGYPIYLTPRDIQLGERESVADVARNLDRWVDLIMARTFSHGTLVELASHAGVPVINGLSDILHPCQVLTDCFTLLEKRGRLDGLRVAFIGDANNVANSWMEAAAKFGFTFVLACPPGYEPHEATFGSARAAAAKVEVTHDAAAAAAGADVLYTDVWTSMGQEDEAAQRKHDFAAYQVNAALLRRARPDALVMHCLPAHRGEEITDEVIDSRQSIVFDQAENRLHTQKGIMIWLSEKVAKHR